MDNMVSSITTYTKYHTFQQNIPKPTDVHLKYPHHSTASCPAPVAETSAQDATIPARRGTNCKEARRRGYVDDLEPLRVGLD